MSLFRLFAKLYTNGQPLYENREVMSSEWREDLLDGVQIQYATLIGWVTYQCGVKEMGTTANAMRLDLATMDPITLEWLAQHTAARLVVKSCQPAAYVSSFKDIKRNLNGSYSVQSRSFRDKVCHANRFPAFADGLPLARGKGLD